MRAAQNFISLKKQQRQPQQETYLKSIKRVPDEPSKEKMRTALGTAFLICELSSLLQEGERACERERTRRRRRRGREGRERLSFGSKREWSVKRKWSSSEEECRVSRARAGV
ncbi:hypothetical protein MHYP_G00153640 [Metynnis hypsauchen]